MRGLQRRKIHSANCQINPNKNISLIMVRIMLWSDICESFHQLIHFFCEFQNIGRETGGTHSPFGPLNWQKSKTTNNLCHEKPDGFHLQFKLRRSKIHFRFNFQIFNRKRDIDMSILSPCNFHFIRPISLCNGRFVP